MERRYKNSFSLRASGWLSLPLKKSLSWIPLQKQCFFHWDKKPIPTAAASRKGSLITAYSLFCICLFTRLCYGGFLLVLEGEGGADRPLPGQGQPQGKLGRGHQDLHQWKVCHGHQAMFWVPGEVYSNWHRIQEEKLKKEHFSSFNSCHFIQKV